MDMFSCFLSSTMDCFGYSYDIIRWRAQSSQADPQILRSIYDFPIEFVHAGSKSEGITSRFSTSSDIDEIILLDDTICAEKAQEDKHFNILQSELTRDTFPGYARVVCKNYHRLEIWGFLNDELDVIIEFGHTDLLFQSESHYISDMERPYLSSTLFRINCFRFVKYLHTHYNSDATFELNGPAVTVTSKDEKRNTDNVFAVYYFETKYLNKWKNRRRQYHWPSAELITEISTSEGYIVPVGHKQSENQSLEWRICFTTAELKLVQSMNSVQLKLYVLLKMIKRRFFQHLCKDITSYVVKNVVFWISETTSMRLFTTSNLIRLLKRCLKFLLFCIRNNHLPNFMIPDRNLFYGAFDESNKRQVIEMITNLVENTEMFILQIPDIHTFMSCALSDPHSVSLYGLWRDNVEKAIFAWNLLSFKHETLFQSETEQEFFKKSSQDSEFIPKFFRLLYLLVPNWFDLYINKQFNEFNEVWTANIALFVFANPT